MKCLPIVLNMAIITSHVCLHKAVTFTSSLTLPPSYTCTGAGVPHIPGQILECLDVKSLVRSEQVSVLWRDTVTVSDLSIWKHLVKNNTDSDKLWRALFERRGW